MDEAQIRERLIAMIMAKVGVNRDEVINCEDIERDLGCTGDDFFELIETYAKEFKVDMTGFLWYFHTHDESMATINMFPGNPPSTRVERIPVTLNQLVEMAVRGTWAIEYPSHALEPRYTGTDKIVSWLLFTGLVIIIIRSCI